MRIVLLPALLLLGMAPAALATDLSASLGENYRRFEGRTDLGPVDLSAGWTDRNGRGDVVDLGVGPSIGLGPLTVGVQAKGIYTRPVRGDGEIGVGLGASASLGLIPGLLSAGVDASYAPGELASGDRGDYRSASARLTANVLPFLSVQGGYRIERMETREGGGEADLAKGFFVGGALRF